MNRRKALALTGAALVAAAAPAAASPAVIGRKWVQSHYLAEFAESATRQGYRAKVLLWETDDIDKPPYTWRALVEVTE